MRILLVSCWQIAFPGFSAAETPSANAIYARTCAACHGENGEGNRDLKSPPIAGLPRWYLALQLDRYRTGIRGTHPEDPFGAQMAAIAKTLEKTEAEVLATHLSDLPRTAIIAPEKGNASRGKTIFLENCAECHRFNASGELTFHSAPLVAFPAWYLRLQFEKFRSGARGFDPKDIEGSKMKVVASITENTANLTDILAYIAQCGKPEDP